MFSANFWESDFLSQTGFDTLVTRMKEGRQTCRELEDFLKLRAKAEEDYAKALSKIARVERGNGETGTLKSSIDVLRHEAEVEASLHLSHSHQLQEEANKLVEFREKQREERRRHEEAMHKAHKVKSDSYRRMQSCKNGYESKYRAAEKADLDSERIKFTNKAKDVERARKNALQARQVAVKADEDYQNSVAQLEVYRQSWEQDHRNSCEIFQRLEEERLQYLRNALWVYSNLGSDLFVKSDDARENVRLSLEKCDIQADLQEFTSRKSTGTQPLTKIIYSPCGGGSMPTAGHQMNNNSHNVMPQSSTQDDYSAAYAAIGFSSGGHNVYKSMYQYVPRTGGEIELDVDDVVVVVEHGSDGWMKGKNKRTGEEGLFPANYVTPQ